MAIIVQRCQGGNLSVQSLQFSKSKRKFRFKAPYLAHRNAAMRKVFVFLTVMRLCPPWLLARFVQTAHKENGFTSWPSAEVVVSGQIRRMGGIRAARRVSQEIVIRCLLNCI